MNSGPLSVPDVLRRSRILSFVLAALAAIAGIVTLFRTSGTARFIAVVIGLFCIIGGISEVASAFSLRKETHYWGGMVLQGVISILFGVVFVAWPIDTVKAFAILFGIFLLVVGVAGIVVARDIDRQHPDRKRILWRGIFSVVAGVVIVLFPTFAVGIALWLIGLYLLVLAVLLLLAGIAAGRAAAKEADAGA